MITAERYQVVKRVDIGTRVEVKGHSRLEGLIAIVENFIDVDGDFIMRLRTD